MTVNSQALFLIVGPIMTVNSQALFLIVGPMTINPQVT
jgi:hypothetical protein